MKQVALSDRPQVHLGRGLKEQLGGGGDTFQGGAADPNAQPVEARLQLGSQHVDQLADFRLDRLQADHAVEFGRGAIQRARAARDGTGAGQSRLRS